MRTAALIFVLLALTGCSLIPTGVQSLFDHVPRELLEEFYRLEGTVTTEPQDVWQQVRDEQIFVGATFGVTRVGTRSERIVFVPVDHEDLEQARSLVLGQPVACTGSLTGSRSEVLTARTVVPSRY